MMLELIDVSKTFYSGTGDKKIALENVNLSVA